MTPAIAPIPGISKKNAARAALVDLKDPVKSVLAECFRQFGIDCVQMAGTSADRLKKEKFEACVIALRPGSETVMESVRGSASNNRMVLYGVGGTVQDALKFSRFGLNAVFNEPIERTTALKLVRSTQMLVLHEFRRYVRIPIITEVGLVGADGRRLSVSSVEISSGGMSLKGADVSPGQSVEVSFSLLTLPRIWLRANVTWRKPELKTFGVRFDLQDERRTKIKQWIESYLEN